jgi:hypothetical protein
LQQQQPGDEPEQAERGRLPFGERLVHVIYPLFDTLNLAITQLAMCDTVCDSATRCQHRPHQIIATARMIVWSRVV